MITEEILQGVRNGNKFKFESTVDPGKEWILSYSGRSYQIHNTRAKRKVTVSERRARQTIENNYQTNNKANETIYD